jgi:hypothetical protein
VNYTKVGFEVDADPVVVRADIGYGYLASIVSGAQAAANTPLVTAAPFQSFLVQQAYASLKLPGTPLTLDLGRFVTGAGSEVIEANKNWLYSRSFLFGIIPFYHTGLRATVKASDQFSAQLTVANSQVTADPDINSGKVIGLQAAITPLPTTSILATAYFGKEGPQGNAGDEKLTLDLVASHNVSDAFGLNLNFDYIKQGPANAIGVAAMARYVAAEHLALALRLEFLQDKGAFLLAPPMLSGKDKETAFEGTVGAAIPFAGHFEARAEVRADIAADEVLSGGKKNQVTGTVAFLGFL